jgi:hypothetical protein
MKRDRLYVCGDSFVDWDLPKTHWIDYLSNHYDVVKLGKFGSDNHSILYQTGYIPDYKNGDRIVIVFTAPGRFPRRYFGERDTNEDVKFIKWDWYKDKNFAKELMNLRVRETESWLNGERDEEIMFLKKLMNFYIDFKPIFVTWNEDFYKKTSDFVQLIKVTSISDEGGPENDWHPGWVGCYDFYVKLFELMNINGEPVKYKKNLV